MTTRSPRWVAAALAYAAALAAPRPDIAAIDRTVERLLQDTMLARRFRGVERAIDRGWRTSRVHVGVEAIARLDRSASIRAGSAAVCIAMILAIGLDANASSGSGPYAWVLPAICAVAAATSFIAADPLARAFEARRR